MADSSIEWTDKAWNPVAGCKMVSPGCTNCYAQTMAKRLRAMAEAKGDTASPYLRVIDERGKWTGRFETVPARLADPLGWRKPARVFVNSMSDLFGEGVPFEYIAAVFGVMAATPRHTYQVLTKRPARMLEFLEWVQTQVQERGYCSPEVCMDEAAERGAKVPTTTVDEHGIDSWPLPNVWLGVSVEDQRAADERIPLLLQVPAAVRFLSCEPLLDWVNLRRLGNGGDALWPRAGGIDWVIVGGESGPDARACKVSWVRDLVRQCSEAGVPAFVKQLGARPDFVEPLAGGGQSIESMLRHGEYEEEPIILRDRKGGDPSEWPEDLRVRQWPEADQ